ncbi:MAG: putative toxin-antitoxin system toxin component, PIN family [Planctomycetota bacterium]
MRVVLDTNVLVAGLLTPHGAPGRIVDLMLQGHILPCVDDRILGEYRDVLNRPKFGFDATDVKTLQEYFENDGIHVVAAPLGLSLPDPDDAMFVEVAHAAAAERLVTGNLRHYPASQRRNVRVVRPGEFMKLWEDSIRGTRPNDDSS